MIRMHCRTAGTHVVADFVTEQSYSAQNSSAKEGSCVNALPTPANAPVPYTVICLKCHVLVCGG